MHIMTKGKNNHTQNEVEELFPGHFLKNQNLDQSLDQ